MSFAAKKSNSDARFLLGSIYFEGLHVNYDIEKAIYYFKEASCLNNKKAKNNLGVIHKVGLGVIPNVFNAIEYFEEAIRQSEDEVAMFNLAHIYFYEENGILDLKKAFKLLIISLYHHLTYSLELLCLTIVKMYESLNQEEIKKDFVDVIGEAGEIMSSVVISMIKKMHFKQQSNYQNYYNKLKRVNLVYYGNNIENQGQKEKIKMKNDIHEINTYFYKGLGEI